jgi:hypothetical protein
MTSLSIQLNQLNVGGRKLDSQQISLAHKQSAESCLTKILSDLPIPVRGKVPVQLRLDQRQITLLANGHEIPLKQSSELRRVQRILRFYQHVGCLPVVVDMTKAEKAVVAKKTRQAVRAVNEASVPGTNGHVLAGMRIADDTLALVRSGMCLSPLFGPHDPIVNHLGYYAGTFWTFFSLRELSTGWAEYQRSKAIGDPEGLSRGKIALVSGGLCSVASISFLTSRIFDSFSAVGAAGVALGLADMLFGVGSLLSMGSSISSAYRCHKFNERLKEYLEHPKLNAVQKMQGALKFLKESVSVTAEEREDLVKEVAQMHPDWPEDKRWALIEQKLADLTEVKVKYMKRRTSNKSLYLILTQTDALLAKLADPKTQTDAVFESCMLLEAVQKENKTKMALYILGLIAALISFVAMLIATFLTAGALPFVLYGIAATLYLSMTLYSTAGLVIKKRLDHSQIENK